MIPYRRLKSVLWFVAIVVFLQLFIFVADQIWLTKQVVILEDCSIVKNQVLKNGIREKLPFPERSSFALRKPVHETKSELRDPTEATNPTIKTTPSTEPPKAEYGCGELKDRPVVSGHLNLHRWDGWCGHAVDDLRRNPLFPYKPTRNKLMNTFVINETRSHFNGRRIFGYIHPPVTGNYTIAISSAEGSELWLSTDDIPKNAIKIAYIGEPPNQYANKSRYLDFNAFKSQISENIWLESGRAYYVEALQKQKYVFDHLEVAWKRTGAEKLEVIDSRYISQYIDYTADQQEITARTACICIAQPSLKFAFDEYMTREKYDLRDDLPFRVETLAYSEVSDVLPSCPYHPSYLVKRKLAQDEAIVKGYILQPLVYPDDRTDTNMSHDPNNHISWGNKRMPEKEALMVVSEYMSALKKAKGERFTLKHIVNIEMKEDRVKGKRYLVELELTDRERGRSVRLAEYLYRPRDSNSTLCYPEGHQWRRNVTITMVVTVKNYGTWIKYLIDQLNQFYLSGQERNFYLVIADFNSTDVDLLKLKENSAIRDRIVILQQGSVFHKTRALNEGVSYVKDPHSIIFTADLHIKFPANLFDIVRKHAIEGRSFYSPAVLKIKCGYSISNQQAYWEMMGYGLFGGYKSDWDSFEGMDAEKFTTRWGGEDWDLLDRAIGAGLEIERLRLPKFYHHHHERKSDWYEFARV